ncbi:DUF1003 domain-containing protein [Verrucomicrobiota bacterium sgz303538]
MSSKRPSLVSASKRPSSEPLIKIAAIRPKLAAFIQSQDPSIGPDDSIPINKLNDFRVEFVRELFEAEMGEVSRLEEDVLESLRQHELVTERLEMDTGEKRTLGDRLADKIATFGGSWTFILLFGGFLVVWIVLNGIWLANRSFDPYPFILLNLVLSCIAAVQAPIIMMSQNRVEARDRLRSQSDYKVNLKAELEIRHINEKLDHLLCVNAERLLEIQQIQLELLRELTQNREGKRH